MLRHIITKAQKATNKNREFSMKRYIYNILNTKFSRGSVTSRMTDIIYYEDILNLKKISTKIKL